VTLSFIDERKFLTVIQSVVLLQECANLAPAESATKPLHSIADSAATEAAADLAVVESASS
jgi:hypothetical protein